jgi:hypothetical protein
MSSIKLVLTKQVAPIRLANANFAYIAAPSIRPSITTSAINNLSVYSNTQAMLGNVATAYSNAINYVETNFANASSIELSSLNDLDDTQKSNNATLVYSSNADKYVVKQLDLDGGNF